MIAIISLLMGILLPALAKAKRQARAILSMNNQKQITSALNLFAMENNDRYPESVATVGFGSRFAWSNPTKLAANRRRSFGLYRSLSAYVRTYIPDADIVHCPSSPAKYTHLDEAWEAGENWDNPDTEFPFDPVGGTYCLFWNYTGFIGGTRVTFKGPVGPAGGWRRSKLLVCDYFGYDQSRSPGAFGSCEYIKGADVTPETLASSAYYSRRGDPNSPPAIALKAGYVDGHVESYSASEAIPMEVSITADGSTPYPAGYGPEGVFYLPPNALH